MNNDIYYLKVGEYDLTLRIVCSETILLSFNKKDELGIEEHVVFTIPLHNTQVDGRRTGSIADIL